MTTHAPNGSRKGLALATDHTESWYCMLPLSVAALARGAYADVVEYSLAGAAVATEDSEYFGIAALAAAYAGDLDEARSLNARGLTDVVSPTMLAWGTYVAGEIEGLAGRSELAEEHYVRAIDLARSSGATFLVGVATVGLLTVSAAVGRIDESLRGYREVIDYFARTGNWTHPRVTMPQPRRPAPPARRRRARGAARRRCRPSPGCSRSRPLLRRRPAPPANACGADPQPGRGPGHRPPGHRAEPRAQA